QRDAQVGADVEQVVLDPGQHTKQVVIETTPTGSATFGGDNHTEGGIRLVRVGIGHQTGVGLGHAGKIAECRGAVVAGSRVDPGEIDHPLTLRPTVAYALL